MTIAQVVETSVTVNDNSPIQDYVHPDDQTQPTSEMTPGFKPFTKLSIYILNNQVPILNNQVRVHILKVATPGFSFCNLAKIFFVARF